MSTWTLTQSCDDLRLRAPVATLTGPDGVVVAVSGLGGLRRLKSAEALLVRLKAALEGEASAPVEGQAAEVEVAVQEAIAEEPSAEAVEPTDEPAVVEDEPAAEVAAPKKRGRRAKA